MMFRQYSISQSLFGIAMCLLCSLAFAGQIGSELEVFPTDDTPGFNENYELPELHNELPMQTIEIDDGLKLIDNSQMESIRLEEALGLDTQQEIQPDYTSSNDSRVSSSGDNLNINVRRELELEEMAVQWNELKKEARSFKDNVEHQVSSSLSNIGINVNERRPDPRAADYQSRNYNYDSSSTGGNNTPALLVMYHKVMNFVDDHPILVFVLACCLVFGIIAKSVLSFSR